MFAGEGSAAEMIDGWAHPQPDFNLSIERSDF
jgi:hypothetical protein